MTDTPNERQALPGASRSGAARPTLMTPAPSPCAFAKPQSRSITPFGQPSHDQLQYTVDRIAADWSAELAHIRENSEELEQQMLECTAKVKSDLTMLFLLGNAVRAEVQRGKEVNAKLVGELSKIVAEAHA